ncbi:MAG: YfiR family protein, partial [Bacteroidia bacterium]
TMASTKKVGNQAFEIRSFANVNAITNCHMLIVAPDVTTPLTEIVSKIKKNSTLLITEKQGFAKQGAAINFVVQNNKPAFELNKTNVEKQDIKVSKDLLSLAILVE